MVISIEILTKIFIVLIVGVKYFWLQHSELMVGHKVPSRLSNLL